MTKLQFSPFFHIEVIDNEQVVLFSEDRYHLLRGSIYVSIARMLIEEYLTEQQLKDHLLSKFSSNDIHEALNRLKNKSFIIPYRSAVNKNIAAFWSELSLPIEPESRLTVGIKNYSRHCSKELIKALESLSINIGEKENFFIVIVDNYISEDIEAFNKARLFDKKPWMLFKPSGRIIWLGPIFEPSHPFGCWECLAQRLKENRRVEVDLFGLENHNHNIPPLYSLPTVYNIAMNLAANEVAKWERSPQKHFLHHNLLTLDMKNLETRLHHFKQQFNCHACTKFKFQKQSRVHLKTSLKKYSYDSERTSSLEDTLINLENIISPITGIISSLRYKIINEEHVCYTIRTLSLPTQHNSNDRYLRIPDVATGKGKTKLQATVGCIAEAIERYNCTFTQQEEIRCCYQDIEKDGIHPSLLLNFSDKQYKNREKTNEKEVGFNRVPKPYDNSEIGWTSVYSMTHDRFRYVPSSYCYLHYPFEKDVEICPGNSNGCASGNSLEEAIFYALLEVIERDAVAIWWYNRLKRPSIDLKSINDPSLDQIQIRFKKADREIYVLDLTTDLQIPCYVAVSWKLNGCQIFFGTGSHIHTNMAILRAINELNQVMIRSDTPKNIDLNSIAYFERDLVKWIITETIENHPHVMPEGAFKPISNYSKSEDFLTDIHLILDILKSLGLEAFLLDLTNPNIQLYTVRVIIPGLRHFWCRLGPGRLYDIPVKLGWIKNALPETKMNPIPYFL